MVELDLRGAGRRFGHRWAVRPMDLHLDGGAVLLLAGPNGAGKTTLARMLATLLPPSVGTVEYRGLASQGPRRPSAWYGEELRTIRRSLGYVGHRPLLYGDLTAWENLSFCARLFGLLDPQWEPRAMALLERLGLPLRRDSLVRTLSRGMQQRLDLVRALLPQPSVLVLDEPLSNLDEQGRSELVELLKEHAQGGGITILSAHDIELSCSVATAALVLRSGDPLGLLSPARPGAIRRLLAQEGSASAA